MGCHSHTLYSKRVVNVVILKKELRGSWPWPTGGAHIIAVRAMKAQRALFCESSRTRICCAATIQSAYGTAMPTTFFLTGTTPVSVTLFFQPLKLFPNWVARICNNFN